MKFYIDLEQTIIDDWNSGKIINRDKVNDFIRLNRIQELSVFSFAIHNHDDAKYFEKVYLQFLQNVFEVKIKSVIRMDSLTEEICKAYKSDFIDIHEMLTKQQTFIEFALRNFKSETVVLLDDLVMNMTMLNHDLDLEIILVNVNSPLGLIKSQR